MTPFLQGEITIPIRAAIETELWGTNYNKIWKGYKNFATPI